MISDLEPANNAPNSNQLSETEDAGLSRQISNMSGALKAKLVMEYLGMNSDLAGEHFSELSKVAVPKTKTHDYRLMQGLLSEVAKGFGTLPSGAHSTRLTPPDLNTESAARQAARKGPPTQRVAVSAKKRAPVQNPATPEDVDLRGEHPRIAALILSTLNTRSAAKALRKLDGRTSRRLALSLSGMEGDTASVSTPVMEMIMRNAT